MNNSIPAGLIGPEVDARADVESIQWLYEATGDGFPVSGDHIARVKAAAS